LLGIKEWLSELERKISITAKLNESEPWFGLISRPEVILWKLAYFIDPQLPYAASGLIQPR